MQTLLRSTICFWNSWFCLNDRETSAFLASSCISRFRMRSAKPLWICADVSDNWAPSLAILVAWVPAANQQSKACGLRGGAHTHIHVSMGVVRSVTRSRELGGEKEAWRELKSTQYQKGAGSRRTILDAGELPFELS